MLSFSHRNCDVSVRERLAFDDTAKETFLPEALRCVHVNEAMILSTCNRIEIFASVKETRLASEKIFSLLHNHCGMSIDELEGRAEVYVDEGAIHHLFSVVSALDSLVIGESQIAGQVKEAFRFAYERQFCSQKIVRAMHYAFKCAALVKNSTEVAKNPVSVSSVAVLKAKEVAQSLEGKKVLVVGIGKMGKLAVKHLLNLKATITIINRDPKKAKDLADECKGEISVGAYDDLENLINSHEILFCATGAPHPIITRQHVKHVPFKRYWFDLSVPRNIEDFVSDEIEIFSVDDLSDIANKNLALREEQARVAYGIVGRFTAEFFRWLETLSVTPTITALRDLAKEVAHEELERALKKGFVPKEYEENLTKLLHNAFKKFLHIPTKRLKEVSDKPEVDTMIESIKYLFNLDDNAGKRDKYKCEYHKEGIGR